MGERQRRGVEARLGAGARLLYAGEIDDRAGRRNEHDRHDGEHDEKNAALVPAEA